MTARYATRNAIFDFVALDAHPIAMRRIARYMMRKFGTSAPAVANHLRRLIADGLVTRPSRGYYQAGA